MSLIATLIAKLLDPVSIVICMVLLLIKREKWMIGVATIVAAVVVETALTKLQYSRTWGQELFVGLVASLMHATLAYLVIRKFAKSKSESPRDGGHATDQTIIEITSRSLEMQIALSGLDHIKPDQLDLSARGYIFGFADAAVQSVKISDGVRRLAIITLVHINLFGNDGGSKLVGQAFADQLDPQFAAGRQRGGTEYLSFVSRGTTPGGLVNYLGNT